MEWFERMRRLASFGAVALSLGCHAGGGPDVPATLAPFFPASDGDQVEASIDVYGEEEDSLNPRDAESALEDAPINDAGSSSDGDAAGVSPANACTARGSAGNAGSALMSPGAACLGCHGARAPVFTFAGSIYAAANESDRCADVAANDALVLIKAANGFKLALTINSAGNFFTQTELPKPYTVELRYQGRTRTKQTPQISGDCNSCHNELGAHGASGRILLP